ncbi:MAG: hypothetical protein QF459_04395, partial [Candidatus Poseidoniia archaeon]|nr:hypothetical protein [Candidatus Poseidoniia archaeon]
MSGGLLVASGPQLFAWAPGCEPWLVAERDDHVRTLCVHDGCIFDGGDSNTIYDTLGGVVVAERASWIYALCSHDGALYDGGRYAQV